MRCIELTGSDTRMDCREFPDGPVNSLPSKCDTCGFPDLNYIPEPYSLIKSRTMSPNELALAENGNFFVRERIHKVLELIMPDEVSFYPTYYKGTSELTPWHLIVPKHQVITAKVNPEIPRCDTCGEPRSAHPGTQYSEWLWKYDSDYEALKSSTWGSSELGWDKWISRDLFMSVRFFSLLKQIKSKGLDECTVEKATAPNEYESEWIKTQLNLLTEHGIPLNAPGTISDGDAKWFRQYLKERTTGSGNSIDWKSLEKTIQFKLPKSYKDFVGKIGPYSFQNVDESDGFVVHVLSPVELDFKSYRTGVLKTDDEETKSVDGVMFARTDHGDCFCFDIQKGHKEYEVFLYLHEYNCFEPYASNFATCIKRFVSSEASD